MVKFFMLYCCHRVRLLICLIILLLLPHTGMGGVTGKISGKVTNKSTGEALPGVNIVVEGTQLGAATDSEGNYFIINVPAGKYTISASIIGFAKVTISDVQVIADFTCEQGFSLTETAISGEEIRIVAEAPVMQKDQTAPVEVITNDEIKTLPIRGYGQVLGLQAGVVEYGGGLVSIRGGRTSETAYYVDGFSQQDPLTGVSSTAINNNAIDQVTVMTGGFSAEYGRVMSGIVNVITKSYLYI
ncbi:MAG: TonB-dependent receptor, partial [Patescibacteria group bacterium]|nr:TonB-dependent receptor [Patescibacteria group bacterium]